MYQLRLKETSPGPYADPGLGRGEKFFENVWGVFGRKNEGGGARPNPKGGETPKMEKEYLFWENFRARGERASRPLRPLPAYGPASYERKRVNHFREVYVVPFKGKI